MPKLNKHLVTSIIADIRESVHVANELYSWLGDIEHLSWKFPTKIARDIDAMEVVKEHNGTAGEFYILLLELAYDRIHFVLRLIVEFMDKYPFVDDFFKEVACVERSNHISLASLLRLIWNRLKTIPDSISRHMMKYVEDETQECFMHKVSRSSQADGSINYCESCTMSSEAILQAVNAIEEVFFKNKLTSAAVKERGESRNGIYGKTQWTVMSRLANGIGTDVETALRTMRESNLRAETTRRDHEKTIRDLRANLTRQEQRADALQAKNFELKDVLENVEKQFQMLQERNVILERDNEKLNESLKNTRSELSLLAGGSNVLQSLTAMLAESKLELERTVIRLRKEVVDTRDMQLETERHFQTLLNDSKRETDSIKDEHIREIEKYQQEITTLRSTVANQKKIIDDNSKTLQEEVVLTPQDDPVADMTQQLIKNQEKIEVLSKQNERLSKTLHRLREHRLTERTVVNNLKK